MTDFSPDERETIRTALEQLEASRLFRTSSRLTRLIHYLVQAALEGRERKLNQSAIAIDVFDRGADFDPTADSIVRVEAGRLRGKLREYYESEGVAAPVRFVLPKGSYGLDLEFAGGEEVAGGTGRAAEGSGEHAISIAALPFDALSHDAQDERLADAVSSEIIDQLGRGTVFDCVSRKSSFAYKGTFEDVRDVSRTLNVDHVLEGSLRRSGDRLRFSVALVDGSDGRQIWSDLYDIDSGETDSLEIHVAQQIVASLVCFSWKITADQSQKHRSNPVINNQSLNLIFNFSRHNCQLGKKLALEAIAKQPDLAESHGVLAFHSMQEYINCWSPDPEQTRLEGLAAASRAIELGSRNYWAQWGAAVAFEWLGEPLRSLMIMESAAILHPDDLLFQGFHGHTLLLVGRVEEGLRSIQKTIDRGPADLFMPPLYVFSCIGHSLIGNLDDAALAGEKAWHGMMSSSASNALFYANALSLAGREQEAAAILDQSRQLSPAMTLPFFRRVCGQAFLEPAMAEPLTAGLDRLDWS